MALEMKKPIEPVIVLMGAIVAIIVGLNLNFVSIKFFGVTLFGYTGLEIIESLVLFGISVFLSGLGLLLYYKTDKRIILSRNLTIIGIFPGLLATVLILGGNHQGRELFVQEILQAVPETTLSDAYQAAKLLSPDYGLAISFVGIILMGLGAYMLNNSVPASLGLTKESALYPDLSGLDLIDEFNLETLKALWYCPIDNNKLASNANRVVPNPDFLVSRERMEDSLNNAVAVRKIDMDLLPYSKVLAEILLKNTDKYDVELVSTICSICRRRYVSPKMSIWYDQFN